MWRYACLLLLVLPLMAQTRIIPHVTRPNGGFTTTVILENADVDTVEVTLQPYSESGSPGAAVRHQVAGQTLEHLALGDLFTDPSSVSHFSVEGAVKVSASYRNASGPGSPAQASEVNETGTRIRLFTGDWQEVFDGIAVVNTGASATDVWVTQLDADRVRVKTKRIATGLASWGKTLYVIGAPSGSEFDPEDGLQFEVTATQPLAITSLRGTAPGAPVGFLWANPYDLAGTASSRRDAQGVWFIEDGTLYDVFEMMGYNVATDRLWQADLYRRSARGTLAAILGSDFVEGDIQARTVGYTDQELDQFFDDMDSDARTVMKAYVDGFNRRIAELLATPSLIPFEYIAVEIQPESWTVHDCMAWLAFLQREFDPNDYAIGQMEAAAFYQHLNDNFAATAGSMFEDFYFVNDPDAPTMIPSNSSTKAGADFTPAWQMGELRDDIDFSQLAGDMRDRRTRIHHQLEAINARVKMGSYAWVVSGNKTDTGNPMIYSGPQMGFSAPAICVEGSIRGGGLEISGMSVPGVPGIIIGRTPHHAWSMQVGHAHTADLYIEPPSALSGGPHHQTTIQVRGGDDVVLDVYRTNHGPVVSQAPIVAWKYAHWGFEFDTVNAFLNMARAESMDDFGDAVADVGVSQHFCYADREGNIAYWMSGRDPVRPNGDFRFPQGTFGTPIEYSNTLRKEIAHDSNPAQGYYGGWNNKASLGYDNAPFGSSFAFGPAHRAHVIQEHLESFDLMRFDDVRDTAITIATTDSFGGGGNIWSFVSSAFSDIVDGNPTAERVNAVNLLNVWDGHFVSGGPLHWVLGQNRDDSWILSDLWVKNVLNKTFADELGSFSRVQAFQVLLHALGGTTLEIRYDWFSNADGGAPQNVNDIVLQALDEALAELGPRPWGTDARGQIDYFHPLLPTAIWTTPFSSRSTYAHCVEMGPNGPVRIQSMFPLGETGLITASPQGIPLFAPQFFGMTLFYDNFNMRQFPLFN